MENFKPLNNQIIDEQKQEDVLILNENDFVCYDHDNDENCSGFTTKGKKCANKSYKNNKFCKRHLQQFRLEKPEDCPICMDSLDNVHVPLSCCHWVHRECIFSWGKDECPVCRSKIKLTAKERKKIKSKKISTEDSDDEFEYPPQFLEYIRAAIRNMVEIEGDEINDRVIQRFFIIDIDEELDDDFE